MNYVDWTIENQSLLKKYIIPCYAVTFYFTPYVGAHHLNIRNMKILLKAVYEEFSCAEYPANNCEWLTLRLCI